MQEREAAEIPADSVALALAFLNLGPADPAQPYARLRPGAANQQIAARLEELAGHFRLVLTQRAVSDALADATRLADGTPVHQMHRHCHVPVYTFAALDCALRRLPDRDWPLVIIAHSRHLDRARLAMGVLAPARPVCYLPSGPVCYQDSHWSRPLYWTLKNGMGWLVDGLLAASTRWAWVERISAGPLGLIAARPRCPQAAQLAPLQFPTP